MRELFAFQPTIFTAGSRLPSVLLRGASQIFHSQFILKAHSAHFKNNKYIHNNPVDAGLVFRPEYYQYSSAIDYAGEKGMIDGVVVVK